MQIVYFLGMAVIVLMAFIYNVGVKVQYDVLGSSNQLMINAKDNTVNRFEDYLVDKAGNSPNEVEHLRLN